jgi:Pathogenicity locus
MQTQSNVQIAQLKDLQQIPGVGPSIARDLLQIGITSVENLKGKDPERLYDKSNRAAGVVQDRCLLYVFRCAVYFAETRKPSPEKLQWWYWKDKPTVTRRKAS